MDQQRRFIAQKRPLKLERLMQVQREMTRVVSTHPFVLASGPGNGG